MAPQSPRSTTEDEEEGHDKHRSVGISHKKGFRVSSVGENGLSRIR
jgi:hypothetical protein